MRISKSTKAWRPCGVEERWKGWQLRLRPAKSFSSRPFSRTRTARAGHFLFFSDGPPQRNTQHIVVRSGRVEGATRGNQKLGNLKLPRIVRSLHRMDCCTQRASPGPTWFGQSPSLTTAGPLSRMTSPTSLTTKWRCSSPSAKGNTTTGIDPCALSS